jgi:hypothetical protein
MATKKIKRFQEGGMSDKDRGLEASKDEKVGFFERLRMGNIDDPNSEAYRRFGAGRGKSDRDIANRDMANEASAMRAVDAYRASAAQTTPTVADVDELQAANARPPITVPAGPKVDQPRPGGKPRVNAQTDKTSAPAKSSPVKTSAYPMTGAQPSTKTYDRSGGPTADEVENYKKSKNLASQIPGESNARPVVGEKVEGMSDTERNIRNALVATSLGGAAGVSYKMKKILDARKAAKAGAKKRADLKRDVEEGIERNLADEVKSYSQSAAEKAVAAKQRVEKTKADRSRDLAAGQAKTKFTSTSKTPSKKTKKFDDEESKIEFKRGGRAYAAGGSVSNPSKRADGIAIKGKTRCKMR